MVANAIRQARKRTVAMRFAGISRQTTPLLCMQSGSMVARHLQPSGQARDKPQSKQHFDHSSVSLPMDTAFIKAGASLLVLHLRKAEKQEILDMSTLAVSGQYHRCG